MTREETITNKMRELESHSKALESNEPPTNEFAAFMAESERKFESRYLGRWMVSNQPEEEVTK